MDKQKWLAEFKKTMLQHLDPEGLGLWDAAIDCMAKADSEIYIDDDSWKTVAPKDAAEEAMSYWEG